MRFLGNEYAPDPAGGAYSTPLDPLAGFKGLASTGRAGHGRKGKRREGEREGRGQRGKGTGRKRVIPVLSKDVGDREGERGHMPPHSDIISNLGQLSLPSLRGR